MRAQQHGCRVSRPRDRLPKLRLYPVERPIEIAVHKMDRRFVKTGDQKEERGSDPEPSPARQIEMFADAIGLVMEQQSGDAKDQAENGHATQWDCHAHHAWPADCLEDKEAQDPIDEVEEVDDILRRREIAPAGSQQRRVEAYLGDEERGQADEASPDHPTHALIILRRLAPTPHEQDDQGAEVHGETRQKHHACNVFGSVAQHAAERGKKRDSENDCYQGQRTFERAPRRINLIRWNPQGKLQ